jgi:8-oxo-dGTP pyrophosphatase MutT (NUDIX family)
LGSAAIREVFEETGILTEFSSIVALRHHHASQFGCSDIYVIVHLTPLVEDQPIQFCNREIVECSWMKVTEIYFTSQINNNLLFALSFLD